MKNIKSRSIVLIYSAVFAIIAAILSPVAHTQVTTSKPLSLRGEIDLDGSGKSVLLLRSNKAQMQVGRYVSNRFQFSSIADPGADFKLAGVSDFDGDGKSDLALVNINTPERGDVRAWNKFSPTSDTLFRQVKHVWDVQAVGDMDGDGKGDLVWRYVVNDSPDTGVSYIWFTDGVGVTQVRKRGGAPLDWTLLGARDLNNDGAADMVYISPEGIIRVLMATGSRTCANYGAGSVTSGFTAIALADFSGGKRADILLNNFATGAVQLLSLDATGIQLPPPSANPDDPNASCTGTAGATIGTKLLAMPALTSSPNAPIPQFYAAGDYDGDGISDVLWATEGGELVLWSMRPNGGIPAITYGAGMLPNGFAAFSGTAKQSPYPMKLVPAATRAAARLLTQATFGATSAEIDRVASIGAQAYLDEQFALPQTLYVPIVRNDPQYLSKYWNTINKAVWKQMIESPDQLRLRIAYALSQILVISHVNERVGDNGCGPAAYWDVLGKNAFGNFRDVLRDVTLTTSMGEYLDMKQNAKIDPVLGTRPNENFARELLQLFSVGTVMLNQDGSVQFADGKPIDTYNEVQVQEFARAFTGWTYSKQDQTNTWSWTNPFVPFLTSPLTPAEAGFSCDVWAAPMEPWRTNYRSSDVKRDIVGSPHDTFPKSLLKYPGSLNRKQELPANQTPEKDLDDAIENIFYHPNVGPFIGELLIQRLVTSNPSGAYVSRVAAAFNDNGAGVRGDMKAIIRAILLDPEATASIGNQSNWFGKLREPVLRFTHAHRAFGAKGSNEAYDNVVFLSESNALGQHPLRAPSVFNFFAPDFAPSGLLADNGLVGPEFEITHSATISGFAHFSDANMTYGFRSYERDKNMWIKPNFDAYLALASNPGALVDALNVVMVAGAMSYPFRTAVVDVISRFSNVNIENQNLERMRIALWLILNSPEYLIQR